MATPPAAHSQPEKARNNRAALRFVLVFLLLLAVLFALANTRAFADGFIPRYLRWLASIAAAVLRLFGESAAASDTIVTSPRFSLNIQRGCDAVDAIILLISGVLAFRAPWKKKLIGVTAGLAILFFLNMARIVSLYYVGVWWPKAFAFAHVEAWQIAFIFISLSLWIAWAIWATRKRSPIVPGHDASRPAATERRAEG